MEENLVLKTRTRTELGSRASRRLRRAGELPALLSGSGEAPVSLAVATAEFLVYQRTAAQLVDLELEGEKVEVLVRDLQFDALGDKILHIDFDRVTRGQELELTVPITFFGEPKGAIEGGNFQTHLDNVNVRCLPRAIPEFIEVDVRDLDIGDEVRLRDLVLPEGVTLVSEEGEEMVALVGAPAAAEEEEELLGEEAGVEPEVLTAKKEKEEED